MAFSAQRPEWSVEGRDWPNREFSRFVSAGGISWHVQEMGDGPRLLLLHGTGAATHSFRDLAPNLAKHFDLLAPDLPGHGFTDMPPSSGLSLAGMGRLVGILLAKRGFEPDIAVGHSAGAAILVEMALSGTIRPKVIIAVNGALLPIRGASLFSPLAKLLFLNPLAPKVFAWRALSHDATRRLLEGTGSAIDARGIELYQRLFRKPGHVAGTLGMMANWDLDGLQRRISRLSVPLVLVSAANDKAVSPQDAAIVAARVPVARTMPLAEGGHLVQEENPEQVSDLVVAVAREAGAPARVETERL
ncbi:alpha/beta fold hydrolase BchO [Mesorhizobium sp. VNQ89]|uniref:alpha/beta fold hydrolase BchO n=1 Tax=Mesorhizobium quangtriensis TaxID=3157709 RepID=UPI0032B71DCE